MLNSLPFALSRWASRWIAAAALSVLLLPCPFTLEARQRQSLIDTSSKDKWRHVTVTIIARGSHFSSSVGDTDYYLALVSSGSHEPPTAARLVHNYAAVERTFSDESIGRHPRFRMYVNDDPYCGMNAQSFVATNVFDPDAMAKVQGYLPCLVVQQ
jgi:hypothetical protein